jgi:hypothetical protein
MRYLAALLTPFIVVPAVVGFFVFVCWVGGIPFDLQCRQVSAIVGGILAFAVFVASLIGAADMTERERAEERERKAIARGPPRGGSALLPPPNPNVINRIPHR